MNAFPSRLDPPHFICAAVCIVSGFHCPGRPGHIHGGHLQLPLLVRAHRHLHHWDDPHQHLLHGLSGGLLLLPGSSGRLAAETHQEHPVLLGLADHLQRSLHDHNEKHTVSKGLCHITHLRSQP